MTRTRWLSLLVCLVVSLVAVAPASAAKPERFTATFDGTQQDVIASCDGFELLGSLEGTITTSIRPTRDGGTVIIDRFRGVSIWTNSVTGKTISSPNVGIDKATVAPDGSGTLASIGLYNRLIVPGQPPLTIEAGRIVLFYSGPDDVEPDVIFSAGQHSGDTFVPTLCSLLAS